MRKSVSLGAGPPTVGHNRRRSADPLPLSRSAAAAVADGPTPPPHALPQQFLSLSEGAGRVPPDDSDAPTPLASFRRTKSLSVSEGRNGRPSIAVNGVDLADSSASAPGAARRAPQLSTSRSLPGAHRSPLVAARSASTGGGRVTSSTVVGSSSNRASQQSDKFALPSLIGRPKEKPAKQKKSKEEEERIQRMIRGKAHKYRGKYEAREVLYLRDAFNDMDRDASGEISFDEFQEIMNLRHKAADDSLPDPGQTRVLSTRVMQSFFNVVDANRSGTITFEELLRMKYPFANERDIKEMLELCFPKKVMKEKEEHVLTPEEYQQLEDLFHLYDADHSGQITFEELRAATLHLPGVSRNDAKKLMEDMDANHDGLVSKEEFIANMKAMFDNP